MMDITVQQKDCDALAGLFQHIVTDLRVCFVVFDFMLTFVLIWYFYPQFSGPGRALSRMCVFRQRLELNDLI